jgi:NAD(P)H-hydrate epimerase
MKILAPEYIQEVDRLTIEREPITSIDLMERASRAFVQQFLSDFPSATEVHVFCGPGNNGGDGLAIARLLTESATGRVDVHVYRLMFTDQFSPDHLVNLDRLSETAATLHAVRGPKDLPDARLNGVVIDALFGSGLNKPLRGLPAATAEYINRSGQEVVSVDIPSGIFAEGPENGTAVMADWVYTFQLPKLAFLLPGNGQYVRHWKILDIGLDKAAIDEMPADHYYLTRSNVSGIFKGRDRFSHKGTFGHALIFAGSKGKAGAAILAARSALRSGLGLLTMHVPAVILDIIQEAVPEAMCSVDPKEDLMTRCAEVDKYSAIGIGPGIGNNEETRAMLECLLENYHRPLVVDADGLNILSGNEDLLNKIPAGSILTPHPGEFRRLAGHWKDDLEKIRLQKEFARKYEVFLVLKGAHTSIAGPEGKVFFNSTGNNGMATAGSGDCLTGMITALLAQDYEPRDAALTGVFVHGLAGDLALEREHEYSLIASDIISNIGQAFKHLDEPH